MKPVKDYLRRTKHSFFLHVPFQPLQKVQNFAFDDKNYILPLTKIPHFTIFEGVVLVFLVSAFDSSAVLEKKNSPYCPVTTQTSSDILVSPKSSQHREHF